MELFVNDVLVMKKSHPCGSNRWQLLRIGENEAQIRCLGCGHELMLPRFKLDKSVKQVQRG